MYLLVGRRMKDEANVLVRLLNSFIVSVFIVRSREVVVEYL